MSVDGKEIEALREEVNALRLKNEALASKKQEYSERAAELSDLVAVKRDLQDSLERQVDDLQNRNDQLAKELEEAQKQLAAVAHERATGPISNYDLVYRYERLRNVFDTLAEVTTCPICFSFFGKSKVISLLCGHSFCNDCWSSWQANHIVKWKLSPTSLGVYTGAPCPECRTEDVKKGQVRIWALEEIVRLVDRYQRESEQVYQPTLPVTSASSDKTISGPDNNQQDEVMADTDEPRVLLERRPPRPYDSHILRHQDSSGVINGHDSTSTPTPTSTVNQPQPDH